MLERWNDRSAKFSCERDCLYSEMAQRRNKVLIQWTEGSCKGETNRVNIKRIHLDAQDITVGASVQHDWPDKNTGEKLKTCWSGQSHKRQNEGEITKKATEDVSETNSEERTAGSGTKTKQMRTSAEKASTKVEKAEESSLKKRKAKGIKGGKGKLHTTYVRTY